MTCQGKIIGRRDGWKIIHIYGEPFERGFAHGVLLCDELEKNRKLLPFIVRTQMKTTMSKYMNVCMLQIKPIIMLKHPEFYRELVGISSGAKHMGVQKITVDFLIAWNSVLSLYSYFEQTTIYRCSAFIATGEHTKNNEIVMAHNTHSDFMTGQTCNIVMKITPSHGQEFMMQTSAGFIASGTDWFICKNGLIGCETTLSFMKEPPNFGEPYFCRVRKLMQYANNLNDCEKIMTTNNAGDYACSWLFGDTHTNEIMMLELGVKTHFVDRTHNGVYYGMNSAINQHFRIAETNDNDHYNLKTSVGSRNYVFNVLLNEKYKGKIDIAVAKTIMSNHDDAFLKKEQIGVRNICKHAEFSEEPKPFGCVDGKVTDAQMVKKMQFIGRFGSSCGRTFDPREFVKKNPNYKTWLKFMPTFTNQKWIVLP